MEYEYKTKGVCSRQIHFDIDDNGYVHNVSFLGGCNGNLKAISKLLDGAKVDYIVDKLKDNQCGMRGTSCADQLAIAVSEAYAETHK